MTEQRSEPDWRQAARRRAILPLVMAAVGVVLIAVSDGTVRTIGGGVVALAVTLAISLAFLEVGLSEDRERERERRRRERRPKPDERPRLGRTRPRRRRTH